MKFYMAEKEAFDELGASETLGDVVRIGFNRVDFRDKDGHSYECYEITEGKYVMAYHYQEGENTMERLDIDIPIDQCSIGIDRDEDQYTIISVRELV